MAFYLITYEYKILFWSLFSGYLLWSMFFLIKSDFHSSNRLREISLISNAIKKYELSVSEPIIGQSDYTVLSKIFFLSKKKLVTYSPICSAGQGQFTYWNSDFRNSL